MASKFLVFYFYFNVPADIDICRHNSNPALALVGTEHFPHSETDANNIVAKSREQQIESGPISVDWSINDHLLALNARISPMRTIRVDLLTSAIRAYSVLWPSSGQCKSVAELAVCLQGTETRLREWRHSSA